MNRTTLPEPCETCPDLKGEKCTREGGHCEEATTALFEKGGDLPPIPEITKESVNTETPEKTPTQRTRKEIDDLKENWIADPCWEIEDTEGFEAHRDELKKFSDEQKTKWDKSYGDQLVELAKRYGTTGNSQLTLTLEILTRGVHLLEERLDKAGIK